MDDLANNQSIILQSLVMRIANKRSCDHWNRKQINIFDL